MPNVFRNFALFAAILVFGIWGLILMFKPDLVHSMLTEGPMNHAYAGMMGAALLGLAIISLATETQWLTTARALSIAVAVLTFEAGFLMFADGSMLVTPVTSMSLVAAASVALFLIF
jgi:hypothetical protein